MRYSVSDATIVDTTTGHRRHQDTNPVTAEWSAEDANMVIWSLMSFLDSAGIPGVAFDPAVPASYTKLKAALDARYATLSNQEVDVTIFPYMASESNADNTANINSACADVSARGGGTVIVPFKNLPHASLLKVPTNVKLKGKGRGSVLRCTRQIPLDGSIGGSAHQYQSLALTGNGASVEDLRIDGGGFETGGVVASGLSGTSVHGVVVDNVAPTGEVQAFQFAALNGFEASRNEALGSRCGFQVYRCTNGLIYGNKLNQLGAGIFLAACENVHGFGNTVTNIEDVGLDIEGGKNCSLNGNFAARCYNAELAFFADQTGSGLGNVNCWMSGNTVHRAATYKRRDGTVASVKTGADAGAMLVSSLSPGTKNCGFGENKVWVEAGAGCIWYVSAGYGTTEQDFSIIHQRVRFDGLSAMFSVPGSGNGLKHTDNIYLITDVVAQSADAKNMKAGHFSRNAFICAVPPAVPLVKLYTDVAGQQACIVDGNNFYGTADNALLVDCFNSGYGSFVLIANRLSDGPTAKGGLTVVTANGLPRYERQRLLIAETDTTNASVTRDLGALAAFNAGTQAERPVATIKCVLCIGGVTRNFYQLMLMSGAVKSLNGTGSGSGVSGSATDFIASVAGSTVTVTKTVAAPNQSFYNVELDSVT